jgi:hypothetical protein
MAKQGFRILDSDMHVMEPPDLWERYIDGKYRARAPRGLTSDNVRDLRMVYPDGRDWARKTTRQNRSDRGHNFERNQEIYRLHSERGWTAEVQLEAMDIEGIDAAVLYPTRGLRALVVDDMEPDFAAAIARAYNDWLYDFCQQDPKRLIGAGMISPYAMRDAVDEARRCAEELGFRAVFLRANPLVNINGTTITMSRYGMPLKSLDYRWGFMSPPVPASARSVSGWNPISCFAVYMPSRWNKCWRSEAFAPAAYWLAIQSCALLFWKPTAVGCRGSSGG